MPSYDELDNEVWWIREFEPPALARFNSRLRAFYGLTRSQCGSKGDNRHLRGRHRSRAWCLNSRYCDPGDRAYGTTDARDKRGPADALRATDLGISGPPFWAACRRVDTAVRAGRMPQLAEWFGTFDGKTVVGWSNGRPASSDSSHLTHGHFGYWTESANDEAFFNLLFETITGDDMFEQTDRNTATADTWRQLAILENRVAAEYQLPGEPAPRREVNGLKAQLDRIENKPPVQAAPVDPAVIAAAVKAAITDPAVLTAIAKAVADEDHARSAE